ncbi:MAG: glycosyltransferase family 4 protein [Candidatus Aminicenantes bacterium]|nr:glycosyltransferase family 4 protein [Candidatus Aminicenantes bacterium]
MDGYCDPHQNLPGGSVREGSLLNLQAMKIGIDAHAAERDGTGNCTYIRNLLLALKEIDERNEYILYATDKNHAFYDNFENSLNFRIKQLPVRNPFLRIPFFLAWQTYRDSLDILHVQYNAPPFHRGKLVVTIHDLGFLFHPESFSKLEVIRLKILTRKTARKSCSIITGSDYSKKDIVQAYDLEPGKVAVVQHGISSAFRPYPNRASFQNVLDKHGIQGRYILSVGRLNPRKNLDSLVKAFSNLKTTHQIPHKLVIVGQDDFETRRFMQVIENNALSHDIIMTGFVPDEDLPFLYCGADVFVYPSLFEGVGLPVLEALKCGVPVVTSNTTSLKEIVGQAGLTVDPLDVKGISQAIFQLICDGNLRVSLLKKGFDRADLFSWKETAQKTLFIYEEIFS